MNKIFKLAVDILEKNLSRDQFLEFAISLDGDRDDLFGELVAEKAAQLDPDNYSTEDYAENFEDLQRLLKYTERKLAEKLGLCGNVRLKLINLQLVDNLFEGETLKLINDWSLLYNRYLSWQSSDW